MKYVKTLNESISYNIVDKIVSYIKKKVNIDLYLYGNKMQVLKGNATYEGKLYLTLSGKAICFNLKNELVSIDIWNNFSFDSVKSDYTMEMKSKSTLNFISFIVNFFVNPDKVYKSQEHISELYTKVDDPFGADSFFEIVKEERVKIKVDAVEDARTIMSSLMLKDKENKESPTLDVFDRIKLDTKQISNDKSPTTFLLITGLGGLGKTKEVTATLNEIGKKYHVVNSDISVAGLYETLFLHQDELILFDDCDSILDDKNGVNILKNATQTDTPKRKVSRAFKGYFNADGMSEQEIWDEYQRTKKLPNEFYFKGKIIFISNKDEKDIDPALLTRGLYEYVNLTKDEVISRMKYILPKMMSDVSMQIKQECFDFLLYYTDNYETKFPLNMRTLVHIIGMHINNNVPITIAGETYPVWQLLTKQYLLGDTPKPIVKQEVSKSEPDHVDEPKETTYSTSPSHGWKIKSKK